MILWFGGLIIVIAIIWLAINQRDARSDRHDVRIAGRTLRLSPPPLVLLVVGCLMFLQGLSTMSSERLPSGSKLPMPQSFAEAMQTSQDRILTGHIGFSFGDAKLVENETRLLDSAAATMKAHPVSTMLMRANFFLGGARIDSPIDAQRRALAIRDHMMGAGIPADRLIYDEEHAVSQAMTPGAYRRAYSGIDFVVLWD